MALAPDQGEPTVWSLDDMRRIAGELEARVRKGQSAEDPVDLMRLPLTRTHLFTFAYIPHRTEPAVAKQHEGVTDIYFITTGTGTIVVGGEIVNKTAAASYGEYTGGPLRGGESFRVKAGDIVTIPPNHPHMVTADIGGLSRLAVKINVGVYPWAIVANPGYTDQFVNRHPEIANRFQLHLTPDHGKPSHWSIDRLRQAVAEMKSKEASGQMELTYMPMEMPYMPWTPTYFMAYARRAHPSRPEQHEGVTDLHYVFEGSATMVLGGEIPAKTSSRAPGEYNGDTIRGGREIRVKAGDILSIPPNVPHSVTPDPGGYSRLNLKINVGLYPWGLIAGSTR
jgi:mannose-6-phosphate isomerase-like protein (cupin superfamily)